MRRDSETMLTLHAHKSEKSCLDIGMVTSQGKPGDKSSLNRLLWTAGQARAPLLSIGVTHEQLYFIK